MPVHHSLANKTVVYTILIVAFFWSCASQHPIIDVSGEDILGQILDGESGEELIGLTVHEFNRPLNHTRTDSAGNFKLTLKGKHPLISITGYYEPLLIEVLIGSFNKIVINKETLKKSKTLKKKHSNP